MFPVHSEDADRFRPYFRFHSGDIEPLWGVDDHWSFGLGVNFNRYTGAELAFDYYLRNWGTPQTVGEASSFHLVPEIRLRYPLLHDRLVPYVVAGVGPSWIQGKDVKSFGYDKDPRVEGWTFTMAVGAGLEYFIADNVTFGIEGRYLWVNAIDGTVGGQSEPVDLSSTLFTFGLRIYLDENQPRPLVNRDTETINRLYFGVRLGADILTDGHWTEDATLRPEQAAWGGVGSQTGGLLLGLDLGEHYGVEFALDHINHGVDVAGYGNVAEYGQGWALVNLRLRFPKERWTPYVYVGGGACYAEFKDFHPGSEGLSLKGESLHPAVNIGAGIEYFLLRNLSFNLDTRWAYSWNHTFGVENQILSRKGDVSHFAATLGFRIYLLEL